MQRVTLRFVIIGVLALTMLVPLMLVGGVAWERQDYYEDARAEVAEAWGGSQQLAGPFLLVDETYNCKEPGEDGKVRWVTCRKRVVFLPQSLDVQAEVSHQFRRRAIYDVPVYQADVTLNGHFELPGPDLNMRLDLRTARLVFGVTHTQALVKRPDLITNGEAVSFQATTGTDWLQGGVQTPVKVPDTREVSFSLDLSIKGTNTLMLSPIGDESTLEMNATWPHPSFGGRYLPLQHDITSQGFQASWSVHELARDLPSSWREDTREPRFGGVEVTLYEPATDYRLVDRGIKYGILFISLTFVSFLCFEIGSGIRFHYVQYGVVGLGLTLFFLGVLSLSEHIPFSVAYTFATTLIAGLISWYVWSITSAKRLAAYIAAIMGALYGALYVLLTLEDYALLAGTAVLFLGLAALMYSTRSLAAPQT